jgi:hypothetical protein
MRSTLLLTALLLVGCPAAGDEVSPPDDQLFFPTGVALAPDESVMFVLNANSDLRYDTGAVSVVDLGTIGVLANRWTDEGALGESCVSDSSIPTIMQCDERAVLLAGSTVRIGNFATEIGVQALTDAGRLRLFAAVRGDPSLTWIDYDPTSGELACGNDGARFPECDDSHRLARMRDDPDLFGLPDEPFDVYVNSAAGFVVVSHLSEGSISIADAPPDGATPVLSDAIGGLFAANVDTGQRGAASVAGRRPGSIDDQVYVTSRSEPRVQTLSIARPTGGLPVAIAGSFFFLTGIQPSDDARGIGFSTDGDRAYIINRDPPMLQIIDTSPTPGGEPRNELRAAVELCQQASNLAVADFGAGERVYVACFRAGQLWVIDPLAATVDAIIDVGRGPHGVAASPVHGQVYVTNFVEDTIAVIDVRPGAISENRLVLRLGRPRQEGSD